MKTIRKNLLLLAFAAGALFVIGNNVLAETEIIIKPIDDGGGYPDKCASIYDVTFSGDLTWPPSISVSCTTGGRYRCPLFRLFCN